MDEIVTLDFPVDPSELPTTLDLPLGDLYLRIKKFDISKSKENEDGSRNKKGELIVGGKKCVSVTFEVAEPEEFAGMYHTKRFWVGTQGDPGATNLSTWRTNRACVLLMKMFLKAKVGGKSLTEYMAAAKDQLVGASVKVEKGGGDYPDINTPKDFFECGERPVRLVGEPTGGGQMVTFKPAPIFGNDD